MHPCLQSMSRLPASNTQSVGFPSLYATHKFGLSRGAGEGGGGGLRDLMHKITNKQVQLRYICKAAGHTQIWPHTNLTDVLLKTACISDTPDMWQAAKVYGAVDSLLLLQACLTCTCCSVKYSHSVVRSAVCYRASGHAYMYERA